MSFFEDKLRVIVERADAAKATRDQAAIDKERERREFLSQFRDKAANVIRPVFERAAEVLAESKSLEAEVRENDEAVIMAASPKLPPAHISAEHPHELIFQADFECRRVVLSGPGVNPGARKPIGDVNDEFVEMTTAAFIQAVAFPPKR